MKALLAITEGVLAELIAFRLELLGYFVEICETKSAMLGHLQAEAFDILLLDTKLPDAGVADSVASVRHLFAKSSLAILMISMDPSLEAVEQSYRLGADDYLLAPFDLNALQTKVDNVIERRPALAKV